MRLSAATTAAQRNRNGHSYPSDMNESPNATTATTTTSPSRKKSKSPAVPCFSARMIVVLLSMQMVGIFVVAKYVESSLNLTDSDVKRWWSLPRSLTSNESSSSDHPDDDTVRSSGSENSQDEQRTLFDSSVLNRTRTPFLDDYRSRKHFTSDYRAPFLIVGGSDGSGTRAIVDTLIELGVFVYREDKGTNDIHGMEMFHREGWPPIVNLVMNQTHSANYELSDLTNVSKRTAMEELFKLKRSVVKKALRDAKRMSLDKEMTKQLLHDRDPSHEVPVVGEAQLRAMYLNNSHFEKYSTGSNIAWKAPVSMLLLPLLKEIFGPIKFLHCVRDGRDVALSDNQSPVTKFYNNFYSGRPSLITGNATQPKAMRLWNDWNLQVMEWAKKHSDGETFDYLTIRSEDLVNPATRFETLVRLAHFSGSKKTIKELCCMSRQAVKDLGKSSATYGGKNRRRYSRERNRFKPRDPRTELVFKKGQDEWFHEGDKERYHRPRTHEELVDRESIMNRNKNYREALADRLRRKEELKMKQQENVSSRQLLEVPSPYQAIREHDKGEKYRRNRSAKPDLFARLMDKGMTGLFDRRGRRGQQKREAPEKVMARYGKWAKLLENQTELSAQLHQFGAESLKAFGYEPQENFLDPPDESYVEQCRIILDSTSCDS